MSCLGEILITRNEWEKNGEKRGMFIDSVSFYIYPHRLDVDVNVARDVNYGRRCRHQAIRSSHNQFVFVTLLPCWATECKILLKQTDDIITDD